MEAVDKVGVVAAVAVADRVAAAEEAEDDPAVAVAVAVAVAADRIPEAGSQAEVFDPAAEDNLVGEDKPVAVAGVASVEAESPVAADPVPISPVAADPVVVSQVAEFPAEAVPVAADQVADNPGAEFPAEAGQGELPPVAESVYLEADNSPEETIFPESVQAVVRVGLAPLR